ncbi:DUF1971 domain-containing protein [Sphingomonas sp. Ag1]|jgi:tellurite resistance-related uncharacterized protein|uniref:DUF1971 domain-containing protein n=1 Tax=Sphingomonas sp. Ag1 TaxID=1642949 RepID=UPI0009E51C5D|nr:DUF1971 domain-containing protein [Sphingomonas sp. Ag1]
MASDQPVAPATHLPEGLESYSRTVSFTEETLPAGLRKDHTTKAGSWGLICVEQGVLRYRVTDPRRLPTERDLTPETGPGVVEPTILHHVEPIGLVRFHVEFLRNSATPVPLCQHEKLAKQENRERSRR